MPQRAIKSSDQIQGEAIIKEMKKVMSKESKDLKKLMEQTVKVVLEDRETQSKMKLEELVTESVKQHLAVFDSRLTKLESESTTRLAIIEADIAVIKSSSRDIEKSLVENFAALSDTFDKGNKVLQAKVDEERQKRLVMVKKLQSKTDENLEIISAKAKEIRDDCVKSMKILRVDIDTNSEGINRLQESLDDLLIKRGGYLSSKRQQSDQSNDAAMICQNLESRMEKLESEIYRIENPTESSGREYLSKKTLSVASDEDLRKFKQQVKALSERLALMEQNSNAPKKSSTGIDFDDVKALRKRVKELGDSTSLVCKSLGSGLHDVQDTTLSLCIWGDKVQAAIGALAGKIGLSSNPCPRVPLQGHQTSSKKL